MTQMVNAYRDITNSPDYADLEHRRLMNAMDENQAINSARREERAKWESERSKMQAEIAHLRAQIDAK
jgi:hypothetical protein